MLRLDRRERALGGLRFVWCGLAAREPLHEVIRRERCVRGRRPCPVRHLSERQVLGKSHGRQPLDGAAQDRKECTTCRMRPSVAAIEPAGDGRPVEGVLEQTHVVAWGPEKHPDFVEAHATPRLLQDPPCDFHALASLTRCGKQAYLTRALARRRLPPGKKISAQRRQVGCTLRPEHFRLSAKRFEVPKG